MGFSDSDTDVVPLKLADRILAKKTSKKQTIASSEQLKGKQSKLTFSKSIKSKVNDSFSEPDSGDDIMDVATPPPREKRATKKTNYVDQDLTDSEDSVGIIIEDTDSEDDFQPIPRKTSKTNLGKSKSSDSLGSDSARSKGARKKTVEPKTKPVSKKLDIFLKKVSRSPSTPVKVDPLPLKPGRKSRPKTVLDSDEELSAPPSKKQVIQGQPALLKPRKVSRPQMVLDSDTSDEELSAPPSKKQAVQDQLGKVKAAKTKTLARTKFSQKKPPPSKQAASKSKVRSSVSQGNVRYYFYCLSCLLHACMYMYRTVTTL